MSAMRWLASAVLVGVVGAAGCAARPADADLLDVKREDLVLTVEVNGELAAVDATDVVAPTLSQTSSFKVAWLAPEGNEVKAGDRVASLDPADLERSVQAARFAADEAQATLAKRREQLALDQRERGLKLREAEAAATKAKLDAEVPPDLIDALTLHSLQLDAELAAMNLDEAKQDAELAQTAEAAELQELAAAQASARRTIAELAHGITLLEITAPQAGTVVYPGDYAGQKRKVGDSVYRADVILRAVRLGAMIGRGQVAEVDVARIAARQPVVLRLGALPDVTLHGTVTRIADSVQVGDSDPGKVVRLDLAIEPTTAALRPGMRFQGQIETVRIPDTVQIPAEAVFVRSEGPVAFRATAGGLERVHLELGRRGGGAIEVRSGLAAGDRVSRIDPEQEAP